MKNIQRSIFLIIAISFLSCNPNVDPKQTENNGKVEISNSEIRKYENVFSDLKAHLTKENGELWNHQLYGPILLVDEKNQLLIANEPDSNNVLIKNGKVFTGTLPKEMLVAETTINWNGKLWTMVTLPLPKNHNEQLSIFTHELFHRIQSKIGFENLQQKPCNHLNTLNGRIFLKLELEALKEALRADENNSQTKHLQNAVIFRLYRHQLFPGAKENENSLELNEGIAEYTGTILSNWNDKELKEHYIQEIDTLYTNTTFVRSFAYRTTPIYGYFIKQKNGNWNKEISNKTDLTKYVATQFNVTGSDNLEETINEIKNEYNYQGINNFETEREEKQKELFSKLEAKFQINPILTIPIVSMNISFSPGDLIPFKDIGTVYKNIRITDKWGSLTAEDALVGKMWKKVVVSEPTEITDTIIKGNGWKLELNEDWKLVKISDNYTLKKK